MEALISQFSYLSGQALQDKSFDPSTIEDLMKLFELESYKAWAAMELEQEEELKQSETELEETENYLDSVMEDAMEEFRRFEAEMNATADAEYNSLIDLGEKARNMGKSLERAATLASKRYIEAAVNSATNSMKSAMRAISSAGKKVHPS